MTEKSKRRWFQFSLRSLLVFVLLVSIGTSWLGVKLQRARKQREVVEAIEKAGGIVEYEPTRFPIPKWVRAVFGEDFFLDVGAVRVSQTGFGDDDAAYLKELTDLTYLVLSGRQITDGGIEHLKGLTNLRSLQIYSTQVTDNGLEHLKGLTSLVCLNIDRTQVTTTGLKHLKGLTNLTVLTLTDTQVTDNGLEYLKGLTNLDRLCLQGTQVTIEGVDSLRQALPNCDIESDSLP